MKSCKKVGLSIVAVVLVLLIFLVIWQWGNIKALYIGLTYTDEKIDTKITQTKEKLAEQLEKEGIVDKKIIDGFSEEDEEKLAKGEISVEEAVEKLFESEETTDLSDSSDEQNEITDKSEDEENSVEVKEETETQPNENDAETQPAEPENEDKSTGEEVSAKKYIENTVKEMYTLKALFLQQLANIERSAKRIYIQGEMNMESKLKIADMMMPQFVEAEKNCDAQVETILAELKNNLNAIGADTSVIEIIREQYVNEKQLQKSKYINEYL